MMYKIFGGRKLTGEIKISGNKNSIFPCVAAALLSTEEVTLENVSNIQDTEVLIQILKKLGVNIERQGSTLKIKAADIKHTTLSKDLMAKLRGSMVLVGAILGRMRKVHFYHPGGDVIGQRSIETHIEGLKTLGALLKKEDIKFNLMYPKGETPTYDATIFLNEASVSATENLILASVLGKRKIVLKNCSKEPHISDLCRMLSKMGARISGGGTDTLVIKGVTGLSGTTFRIGIDYIEVGTYIVAAAVTGGKIKINGLGSTDLDPVIKPLERFGIVVACKGERLEAHANERSSLDEQSSSTNERSSSSNKLKSIPKLTTNIWPGFPTDLMSVAIVLATQSKGITLCHDWMYESRMFFVDKLISMGAKITLADPHRVFVYGPTHLRGRELSSPDIRAGMALVLAALVAKGESQIHQAELIERGYEDVVGKLNRLGAEIERSV